MHDIICPRCGESFIARDVAFDFSDFILPLLSDEPSFIRDLKRSNPDFKFEYFIDEEDILSMSSTNNNVRLETNEALGPGLDRANYHLFEISNKNLLDYIARKNGLEPSVLDSIMKPIEENFLLDKLIPTDSLTIQTIERIYRKCFPTTSRLHDFDISTSAVNKLIELLCYIFSYKDKSILISARMYCSKMRESKSDYYVPDVMFILNNNGNIERRKKSCRCCGHKFPDEFGYYKMIPVTILGSAFSGKTSLILSLLWSIKNRPPFNRIGKHFTIKTLNDDDDLILLEASIKNYEAGYPPDKTVWSYVPILSFLINNVIYTFTDWPGEAFIYDSDTKEKLDLATLNFAYDSRRIIAKSRHFICVLDPEQVVRGLGDGESVFFDETELMYRFIEHINLANTKSIRSVLFLANKFDLYKTDINAQDLNELVKNISESSFCGDNGQWEQNNWNNITEMTFNFLKIKIPTLISGITTKYEQNNLCFIPVAPYGKTVIRDENIKGSKINHSNDSRAIKMGFLSGLPLLYILKTDGIIK